MVDRQNLTIERRNGQVIRPDGQVKRQVAVVQRGILPRMDSIFRPDSTEVDYPEDGDLLDKLDAETRAVIESVRRDRKEYADFIKMFDDHEFYFCLVFQSKAQKEEFLEKAGWLDTCPNHNYDNMFLNGLEVARRLGVEIKLEELTDYGFRGKPENYRKEVIPNAYSG